MSSVNFHVVDFFRNTCPFNEVTYRSPQPSSYELKTRPYTKALNGQDVPLKVKKIRFIRLKLGGKLETSSSHKYPFFVR